MYLRAGFALVIGGIVLLGILLVAVPHIVERVFDRPGRVEVSAFFIDHGATLSELPVHESYRRYLVGMSRNEAVPTTFVNGFPLVGHRVKGGEATVISYRKYIDTGGMETDGSLYEKLTIMLPPEFVFDDSGSIDLESSEKIIAFWSQGSSDFPDSDPCVGYADRGRIKYARSNNDWLYAFIDLSIGFVDSTQDDCRPFAYREEWMFKNRNVDSLSPWEGRATGGDGYLEAYPSNS